ncbi:unnamed protein product [Rotaria magnacalcarata]|uniref:Uncharacterized protein n=2 Tax=Rotaria magnacalcarata TaxID=392030 RepID=A0A816LH84_9BILA|nr:unnamed protein product [Rotaria magnacalcarata]
MAAFGISFPKLTFCRTPISKIDNNTDSTITAATTTTTTTTTATPITGVRTLSLSIKNIPSQPLHYDISTTTVKKKTTSFTTMLAIDGETKQLPKTLSVFNELQLDDEARNINERRRREENSSGIIVPPSLSPLGTIDYRPDIQFLANVDSKKILHDSDDKEKKTIQEKRSNQTFTPPTASLSNESVSSSDLHLSPSAISVDLPQLKYAIEKLLIDDNDDHPAYQIAEEFSPAYYFHHQDHNGNANRSNEKTSELKYHQYDRIDNIEFHPILKTNINNEVSSSAQSMSNNMKWYVSELRINRPLIYRTQWTYGQQRGNERKLSRSVNDFKQIYNIINRSDADKKKAATDKIYDIANSNLSLQYLNDQQEQQQRRHQSDDNILRNKRLSYTDDDLNDLHNDKDDQHRSPIIIQRTLDLSLGKADKLIRNESVKQKLFDILNDDELENACLEDMSQEFEQLSLTHDHHRRDLPIINSFSSSSDDALYSSPPDELHLSWPSAPPHSSSYNENLSTNINHSTERYFGRSRLITTSLDKIPMNYNTYDHNSSFNLPHSSYEKTSPSWYTSPSPQWRTEDQLSMVSMLKKYSSKNDDHLNGIDCIDPNQLLRTNIVEYEVNEHNYVQKYNHHHRKEQKHVNYSLLNTSTPLVDDSTTILPIIQDKSSNLLMFI